MTATEKNAYRWRWVACVWQTLTIAWQWTIVFVFWGFCAAKFLPPVPWIWRFGLIWAHTWPFVAVMVNFYMTDSRVRLRDFWHGWVLGTIYCIINYHYTKIMPEPVYPFLLWEHIGKDVISCIISTVFGTICLIFSSFIQEKAMGRPFCESW